MPLETASLFYLPSEALAKEGDPEALAKEGDPEALAKEGDPEALAKEGDPEALAKEGDPEALAKGVPPNHQLSQGSLWRWRRKVKQVRTNKKK
ncbi:MAG: hypothetical protein ACOYXA_13620 [Bacteroidota bacterium]